MLARKSAVFASSAAALVLLGLSPAGCGSDMVVGFDDTKTNPPPFEAPDAGPEASTRTLTDYFPT